MGVGRKYFQGYSSVQVPIYAQNMSSKEGINHLGRLPSQTFILTSLIYSLHKFYIKNIFL